MSEFSTYLFQHEWIPASRSIPRSRQKVMIVLHGHGDSLKAFRDIKNELRIPNMNYLLLNAPRRFAEGYTWCALSPRTVSGVKQIREKLFALVDELKLAGWRPDEVFWMGHSQGCFVACDVVLNHPDVFGGLIGVSGYLRFFHGWKSRAAKSGARRTPWLITHGTRDRLIKLWEIRRDIQELTEGDVPVLFQEFLKGHDFDFRREVPFIRRWIGERRSRRLARAVAWSRKGCATDLNP
jgi:phospholipase/carboxylesterase